MATTATARTSKEYMRHALTLANKSPPKPTNFCVGAVLVDESTDTILSTGYTLELPGNTHAEQCCLQKFSDIQGLSEEHVSNVLPERSAIYTTMEPCGMRLSGNLPCVDRIIRSGIKKVYHGVKEPEIFVGQSIGRRKLEAAGIECIHVEDFEEEILKVATAGHGKGDEA